VFTPVLKLICKDQNDREKAEDRIDKACLSLHKFLFYTFSSAYGWYILKDTEILPWYLGGQGTVDKAFIGIPWQP
jgi:hypothetical protein